jgi:hypothetical protein
MYVWNYRKMAMASCSVSMTRKVSLSLGLKETDAAVRLSDSAGTARAVITATPDGPKVELRDEGGKPLIQLPERRSQDR